jgi:hypothetical protein
MRGFMKRLHLQRISFIMTAVYLLITLSPLASLSSWPHPFKQALAKECSGDCRQCGCSAERSAAHTCCCAQKRAAEAKKRQQCALNNSLPPVSAVVEKESSGDCCSKYLQQYATEKTSVTATLSENLPEDEIQTVSISTCPCGSGSDLIFPGAERSQHIPFRYLSGILIQSLTQFAFLPPERLASRSAEPPDPPPKLS